MNLTYVRVILGSDTRAARPHRSAECANAQGARERSSLALLTTLAFDAEGTVSHNRDGKGGCLLYWALLL